MPRQVLLYAPVGIWVLLNLNDAPYPDVKLRNRGLLLRGRLRLGGSSRWSRGLIAQQ
jgi:hypothetical protein